MKNKYYSYFIIVLFSLVPCLASAQYSNYGWYNEPDITPSGPPVIIFPVEGGASFTDDFSDARSGGREHEGNDLLAPKMSKIIAAMGGRIGYAPMTEPSYGYMLTISGDDGYRYSYIHINNDTPGTDDGNGGPQYAYAPGIEDGARVVQGQHIAWVGDSGNAESTASHLHFEIRFSDGVAINPYQYLLAAIQVNAFDRAATTAASPTINVDKSLTTTTQPLFCLDGSLIRTQSNTAVYYCGADGKRYVFPDAKTYSSWYKDFSTVKIITAEALANISLGGVVTYRPGVKLVKIQTDPHIYAVDFNGTLRLMITPAVAAKYYGVSWESNIAEISEAFFFNYKFGESIIQ